MFPEKEISLHDLSELCRPGEPDEQWSLYITASAPPD